MKTLLLIAVLLPAAVLASSDRLCPDGYRYLGDDVQAAPQPKDWVYEEVDRTEVYSCYKLIYDDNVNWLTATHKCWDEDAQLASFEMNDEMERTPELRQNSGELNVLTSGMRFSDGWYWVGSNMKVLSSIPLLDKEPSDNPAHPDSEYTSDCLAVSVSATQSSPDANKMAAKPEVFLKAVPCTIESPEYNAYMCEARVQTVTYRTWFQANWIDFTLTALIIILFVALCVTLCCYPTQKTYYRNQRPPMQTRRPRTTDQVMTSKPPAYDMPPNYDSAVNIHRPVPKEAQPVPLSMMDKVKKGGSELVAKVYYYRTPATNGNANGSTNNA